MRANIDRLVGGAGEETIIARVGEGIVTTVGSSESHKAVLENPDSISNTVLDKGLMQERLLKSYLSMLQMLMWVETLVQNYRPIRQRPINA